MKIDIQTLDCQLLQLYSKYFDEKPESLRKFLSDSPTQYSDVFQFYDLTRFHFRSRRRQDLQRLAVMSWYFPEEIRILFQLNLKEHWDGTDPFNVEKEILLDNKELCLAWVLQKSGWTESDFFGNVLNVKEVKALLQSVNFFKISRKRVKKYTGYCRGYRESNPGAPRSFSADLEKWVEDEEIHEKRKLNHQLEVRLIRQELFLYLQLLYS